MASAALAARVHAACCGRGVVASGTVVPLPSPLLRPCLRAHASLPNQHSTFASTATPVTATETHVGETAEEAKARRLRESAQVESRVVFVETHAELQDKLASAGDKLVVLEIHSDEVCESGVMETAELHWKADQKAVQAASMDACRRIKHTFQRTARECPNVLFFEIMVPQDEAGEELKAQLGVSVLPTLQFIRGGRVLWQEQGYEGMERDMGEGVLFYGAQAGGGLKATDYVHDITTRQQWNEFRNHQDPKMLQVLNVSTSLCKPCIKAYPAVVALAKNFQGHATFGRLLGDDSEETEALLEEMGILEVPTFVFYRGGVETGRLVSSARGDLIGTILQQQADAGIKPPPPPPRTRTRVATKRTITRRV